MGAWKGHPGTGIPAVCGWCDMKPERRHEEDDPGPVCDHYESGPNPYPFLFEVFCKHCKHPPKCHPGYIRFGSLGPKVGEIPLPEANRPRRKPKPGPVHFTVLAGDFYPSKDGPPVIFEVLVSKKGDAMKEETPEFLGKHIPPKEETAAPELTSEARIDHSHDLDGCGWTNFELLRTHKKLETAKGALRKIASCKSTVEGDVVDIAQKALKEIE